MRMAHAHTEGRQPFGRIFWLSTLILFLEMVLIRWVGTEVRIFAYLQNSIIIVCFLALAVGCMSPAPTVSVRQVLVSLLILSALISTSWGRTTAEGVTVYLSYVEDFIIWFKESPESSLARLGGMTLGVLFLGVVLRLLWNIFVPFGRLLGHFFSDTGGGLGLYSANIVGSLAGVLLYSACSAFSTPPVIWILVAFMLFWFVFRSVIVRDLFSLVLITLCLIMSFLGGYDRHAIELIWTPYQKIRIEPYGLSPGARTVRVNNVTNQLLLDLRDENVRAHPEVFKAERVGLSQYDIPYLLHPAPRRALVVGAGTGNDVAGALRHGAERVVAVEIDPEIIRIGRQYHPERPYDSPRVQVINDDARAYFHRATEQFDVIVFGLLDAHTASTLTTLRLDDYVYTVESLASAKKLLAPGGVLIVSFGMPYDFIIDRMANTFREVFGEPPRLFQANADLRAFGVGGRMYIGGDLAHVAGQIEKNPRLAHHIERNAIPLPTLGTAPATDDWPYLYLRHPHIPMLHWIIAGVISVLFLSGFRSRGFRWGHDYGLGDLHFMALGAAFLLLEVSGISRASLILGNTWIVNAVVVAGFLVMVFLSNEVVRRGIRVPITGAYLGLFASALFLYRGNITHIAPLGGLERIVVLGATLALPVLFSGIVFSYSFARTNHRERALGMNLLGALIGGILQMVAFLAGMKFLSLIVLFFYAVAFFTRGREVFLAR